MAYNTLESVTTINSMLKIYDALVEQLHLFVYLKAADLRYVYSWRLQQEADVRAKTGTGVTDEQVTKLVDGYLPAYELHSDALDRGLFRIMGFADPAGKQITLVVDENREVEEQK